MTAFRRVCRWGRSFPRPAASGLKGAITAGAAQGATAAVDGRGATAAGLAGGSFVGPTVLDGVPAGSELAETEIFGPAPSLIHAADVDEAIAIISGNSYGNASSIFTSSGAAARKFRYQIPTGNVGINIGVAASGLAHFPFSGWKGSFLGVLHAQGRDAVEFYTDTKGGGGTLAERVEQKVLEVNLVSTLSR